MKKKAEKWTSGPNPRPVEVRGRIVGETVVERLDKVSKNNWNPNAMTVFERQSLRRGLETDGWLVSHALTIWGTDEAGREQNVIIDGEHRWEEARALGMLKGPMVFLYELTRAEAMKLTVKLDAKRGHFSEDKLGALLRAVEETLDLETRQLDMGIEGDRLAELLRDEKKSAPPRNLPSGQKKPLNLFFDGNEHAEFMTMCHELAKSFDTKTTTATVLEAVKRAYAQSR
jgi:hypothetical protein